MMGAITMEAPPIPVPLAEAKAFLRISTSEEDALLTGMVRSAAEACEAFTGRLLVARTVEETLPASAAWTRLGAGPVRAIDSVAALAADGTAAALPPDAYSVDIDAAGDGWVRVTGAGAAKRVRVGFQAGLAADWNGVPEALRQGIVRLAAHLYSSRDAADRAPPAAVTALWRPWRRLRIG